MQKQHRPDAKLLRVDHVLVDEPLPENLGFTHLMKFDGRRALRGFCRLGCGPVLVWTIGDSGRGCKALRFRALDLADEAVRADRVGFLRVTCCLRLSLASSLRRLPSMLLNMVTHWLGHLSNIGWDLSNSHLGAVLNQGIQHTHP